MDTKNFSISGIQGKGIIMRNGFHYRMLVVYACCLVLLAGCSMSSRPLFYQYDAQEKPVMTKRFRRHVVRDFKARFRKEAYTKNNTTGPHFLLSSDQKTVKEKYGPPDYISFTFLSLNKDYVKEWLYWKKGLMFQFVNRKLVYEGLLTDKERILVEYGYPDDAQIYQTGDAFFRENYYYHSLYGTTSKAYFFINGKCVNRVVLQ